MTPAQVKFVELEKKKEEVKKYFEQLDEATLELAKELGVNNFFQDADGIVYQVVIPTYKSVKMDHVGYVRTKRQGEARGSLSVKKAEEAGFTI